MSSDGGLLLFREVEARLGLAARLAAGMNDGRDPAFHHISPRHADLYFNEIGFRWSQRTVAGQAARRTKQRFGDCPTDGVSAPR